MTQRASGTFLVSLTPHPPYDERPGATLGRISLAKTFDGDLAGSSTAEMLSVGTPVQGSAAYVAVERFVGTLHGREGTFVLQHCGTMGRGTMSLSVKVVADSGTGALHGIEGTMIIRIEHGRHEYDFDYEVPAAATEG